MMICWFASFQNVHAPEARASESERAWLASCLAATPYLHHALIHTPSSTRDPYLNDGPPPVLALQLYFRKIEDLEAALAPNGYLHALARDDALPSLNDAIATQQAMLVRRFPTPDPTFQTPTGELPCTYLVAYEGRADDLPGWLAHYIDDHPPIMARFPNIREIEVYTRIDWCGSLPWARVEHMQRNKVVFDTAAALTAALNSQVRHEMRAGFSRFPSFTGPITHYPMATTTILPSP